MTDTEFTLINGRFDAVEKLIGDVNTRLDTLNSKVYTHETIINEAIGERKMARENQKSTADKVLELESRVNLVEKAEITHIINCPINPKLRIIEDKLLSQQSVKRFMGVMFVSGIGLGGFIVALLKLILG